MVYNVLYAIFAYTKIGGMDMKYEHIKRYGLKHEVLARAFGYKNVGSFRGSSAHRQMMDGVEEVLSLVRSYYRDRYKELFGE
jgi:hypothetical protein